jgi:superfamily II DNA or RNA helicase
MLKLNLDTARALVNFRGENAVSELLAEQQLAGTVALHNMLAEHRMAYLADEVGMGKTYIALGVVALMRRFKPDLRVLYLLPKTNVRDKWRKDYRSFIATNYKHHDGIVKGFGHDPAASYRNCHSLSDLMQAVATDSVRDYFVCTSAFSLALEDTNDKLSRSLDEFGRQLPQYGELVRQLKAELDGLQATAKARQEFKRRIKTCWATALHGILPRFDLVVVDEAHNYRRGLESSDRNLLLSAVLGTTEGGDPRLDRLLLLSATPFDRDVSELRRQLTLFGKGALLSIAPGRRWEDIHQALAPFTVRRLNSLTLGGAEHTRNMYRTEHRTGREAEITLGLEQQLFAAVMQKKVGEVLNGGHEGKFELGMLASFESYLPNDAQKPVQFDGQDDDADRGRGERDAADRTIVNAMVHDFERTFGRFPPHPKMDEVARKANDEALQRNKKQLIFVRRVASVGELKAKLEDGYNDWLAKHVARDAEVSACFGQYRKVVQDREHHRLDDTIEHGDPATFFSWFYRGENPQVAALDTTPHNLRQTLLRSATFDIDWSSLPGMPSPHTIDWNRLASMPPPPASPTPTQRFMRAQYAYLSCVAGCGNDAQQRVARRVLGSAFEHGRLVRYDGSPRALSEEFGRTGLWTALRVQPALRQLALPWDESTFAAIAVDDDSAARVVRRHLMHAQLFAALCRLDHPFIDLYSLRQSRGNREEGTADERMTAAFVALLAEQSALPGFSSFTVLRDLTEQLDLILKQNFEDIDRRSATELTTYIANQLHPLSPVLGATGDNAASRSAIARKFRMPGYPRALVSTDVFQEGEDLHTFCDSVIHYGISSSPIALEQKVGRVDRIGSLSHRAMGAAGENYREHFIQVGFPHIRQSLEFLQVRAAAHNLNEFLISLQRVDGSQGAHGGTIDLRAGLLDQSGIEPPISFKLESPFTIGQEWLVGERHPLLEREQAALVERRRYCSDLVDMTLRRMAAADVPSRQALGIVTWDLPDAMTMQLRGAQGSGQLILCASKPSEQMIDRERLAEIGVFPYLSELQKDPAVRLQLPNEEDEAATGGLIANAEIYAGGADILSELEVRDLYCRLVASGSLGSNNGVPSVLADMVASLCREYGSYTITAGRGRALNYNFKLEERRQEVRWELFNSYVLVRAEVLSSEEATEFAEHPSLVLSHTLRRNRRFDVVDFHVDANCGLSVRALHPVGHLNLEELAFICHQVASNAQRLRQVLTNPGSAEEEDEDEADDVVHGPQRDNELRLQLAERNVMCLVRDQLERHGTMQVDDLIRNLARELGWKRTSQRMKTVLTSFVAAASRRRIAVNRAGVVELYARSIADYDIDFLKDQFLAALSAESAGHVERVDAVRAFARWMGFARTGQRITDTGAVLIRRLIRAGRLAVEGSAIKRS